MLLEDILRAYEGEDVHEELIQSGRDVFLFGIPLVLMLAVGIFRLDEVFARRQKPGPSGAARPVVRTGSRLGMEPDGRPLNRHS
jgi:hypothetical protein